MKAGLLIVNKPAGITSHDVIDRIRRITGEQRVGHAGTLDPFATGVLVVGVGREATKLLGHVSSDTTKSYEATIHLGAVSSTDDPEGEIVSKDVEHKPTHEEIHNVLRTFVGAIQQVPPPYSSVKIGGVRAYKRARRGEDVHLAPHTVTIYEIILKRYTWPELAITVSCSSGTYIRSLARDIGEKLGTGAYCSALVRTAVGEYVLAEAHMLDEIEKGAEGVMLSCNPPPRTPPRSEEGSETKPRQKLEGL